MASGVRKGAAEMASRNRSPRSRFPGRLGLGVALAALLAGAGAGPAGAGTLSLPGGTASLRVEPASLVFDASPPPVIRVEIDWMEDATHSHRPSAEVLDQVRATFAAAGYEIELELSDAIPHQDVVALTGAPSRSPDLTALRERWSDHLDDDTWHYSLWAHNYSLYGNPTSSSGYADLPGRVHLVTLGSFPGKTGTFSQQVGTFVHELGHNLGQRHGGADNANYKPNYPSVMNYLYQLGGIGPTLVARGLATSAAGFDDFGYSHGLLPELDESRLDESRGIGLARAVDWNCDGKISAALAHDVQASARCGGSGGHAVLADYDNWGSVAAHVRGAASGNAAPAAGAGAEAGEACATWEEHRPQYARLQRLRARGVLPPDGPRPVPRRVAAPGRAGTFVALHNDTTAPLTVTGVSLDQPAPWLSWEPQAPFTIPAGGSQRLLLRVDLGRVGRDAHRQLRVEAGGGAAGAAVELRVEAPAGLAGGFYTLSPCRVLDTRLGGGPLAAGQSYAVAVAARCGVPRSATAVALNVTAIGVASPGSVALWPSGPWPGTDTVAFRPGQAIAVGGIHGLAADGTGSLTVRSTAAAHLILDVAGWFE